MSTTRLPFEEVFADESGGNIKTPQSEYKSQGRFPVVDQGKSLIAGYVDEEERLCGKGRPAIVFGDHTRCVKYIDHPFCMGADGVKVLRPKISADLKYLYYYLKQVRLPDAGYDRHFKYLKRTEIVLPPLEEQRRIATTLNKADALRAKCHEVLTHLDRLAQSIFVEMFGDPVTNPKGWPVAKLESFLLDVTNGLTRRGSETDEGEHIVLRLRDIKAGSIDFSAPNRITLSDKERAKYQVSRGELLFIRVNGNPDYVGRCALFDGHAEQIFFNDHVMRVRLKCGLTGGYLCHFLNRPEGKREVAKHRKTSAGQHTINQDGLGALTLPIPDESLQRRFLARLASIRKLAATQTNALAQLDTLFASVQHRAFRGEL